MAMAIEMAITPAQIRAGRALLNWTAGDLTKRSGVAQSTLSMIENGQSEGMKKTLSSIENALTAGGVEFTQNGVALRDVIIYRLDGAEGFQKMMDEVYAAAQGGSDICLFNGSPDLFIKWLGQDFYDMHRERMKAIKEPFSLRIITAKGDQNLIARSFAKYRWTDQALFGEKVFYVYSGTVCFLDFKDDVLRIQVIVQNEMAETMRGLFNIAWLYATEEIV